MSTAGFSNAFLHDWICIIQYTKWSNLILSSLFLSIQIINCFFCLFWCRFYKLGSAGNMKGAFPTISFHVTSLDLRFTKRMSYVAAGGSISFRGWLNCCHLSVHDSSSSAFIIRWQSALEQNTTAIYLQLALGPRSAERPTRCLMNPSSYFNNCKIL